MFCVYCLYFVPSLNRSQNALAFFLTYHISDSIWDPSINCSILHPLSSQFCSTSSLMVALLNYSTPPPFFLLRWKPCCFSTDYQMTEWILLLSMRHSVNVNHIRHKLIHLNGIETIYVFRIALNGGRPVDMLWTTRTKCLLLFFFSVTRNTFEGTTKSVESGTCVKYFSKTEIKGTLTI